MSDEKLQWAFDLVDKISGPAAKMEKAIIRVERALEGGGKAVVTFEKNLGKANLAASGLKNTFGGFGGPWGTFVGGLQVVSSVLTDIAWGFGEAAIKAMAFRESTIVSFKAMTGSAQQANELFKRSVVLADITPFGTKDVVTQVRSIMGSGFKQKEAENVFAALSDVASISGGGAQAMQGMLTQIAQAKGIGKFQLGDLKIIMSYAGQAGVSLEKLYAQIAEQEKIAKASVPDALSTGRVGFDSGLFAIMKVIERDISGGKLGSRTLEQGLSLTGLLSTIESLPEKAMLGLDPNSAGGTGLRRFLDTFINMTNASVNEGGRLNKLLVKVADDFGVWLGGLASSGELQRFFDVLLTGLERGYQLFGYVIEAGRAFWDTLKPALESSMGAERFQQMFGDGGASSVETFGAALKFVAIMVGEAVAGVLYLAELPQKLQAAFGELQTWASKNLFDVGLSIGKSIASGVMAGMGINTNNAFLQLVGGWASSIPEKVKDVLEIKSPSRVMERLGEYSAEGFQRGLDSNPASPSAVVGGAIADARAAGLGRGGGDITITAPITITITSSADAEGVARELNQQLETQLSLLFRRLASEVGT